MVLSGSWKASLIRPRLLCWVVLQAAGQTWRAIIATSPDRFPQWIRLTGVKLVEKASGGKEEAKQARGWTKLDRIAVDCFTEDREMFYAIKEAFKKLINKHRNKPAELLAKFLNLEMQAVSLSMNEAEIDTCLNHVLFLFRYSQAEDIFEGFYEHDLAKWLL
ncbi:hypothetical protein PTTG_29118 [Puccinia triticina 1-1 BBBD Race 1]|uniref:CULLIN_2 domain-containing protein n=1 Tax=Puccinia triticina (isolate 1-1 / race 1 (BBBD)) TaxID=630390 RepID=A0A180G685_PUCT1|nr:hypothetical protein PTTG_29118 [Puccinia triticina 1-1 BBBD Race 1]